MGNRVGQIAAATHRLRSLPPLMPLPTTNPLPPSWIKSMMRPFIRMMTEPLPLMHLPSTFLPTEGIQLFPNPRWASLPPTWLVTLQQAPTPNPQALQSQQAPTHIQEIVEEEHDLELASGIGDQPMEQGRTIAILALMVTSMEAALWRVIDALPGNLYFIN